MNPEDINNQKYICTQFQKEQLKKLADAVSELEALMDRTFLVTSGLRTPQDQLRINPSVKNSAHTTGSAVDISDVDGSVFGFCIDNVDILIRLGLYIECRTFTPRWLHAQIVAPRSGHRIFNP